MKLLVVVLVAAFVGIVYSRPEGKEQYTTKYDNIDLDEIIKSDRLVNSYFKCLMGMDKCTPDGAELKKVLPEAIADGCSKCSDKHKAGSKKIVRFLIDKKPELWAQLEKKFDPEGTYKKTYAAELKKEGFEV